MMHSKDVIRECDIFNDDSAEIVDIEETPEKDKDVNIQNL